MIPHSRPCIGQEEERAATEVIRSGNLAQGHQVARLEDDLADRLQSPYVVVVSSGTAALHLALIALGCGPPSRVAIPSYVCSALLHAVCYTGAEPILVDLPASGYNIIPSDSPSDLDAIIVPHMFGVAASDWFSQTGIPVIEDCAMALGATSCGRALGTQGKLGVFSFYATKMICAGEGGAVATADEGLARQLEDLRDYDGRSDATPRYNYKMTDLQAAIARVQLTKLGTFIERRRSLAETYIDRLSGLKIDLPAFGAGDVPYRFVTTVDQNPLQLEQAFDQMGVSARRPVPTPIHRLLGASDADYPQTATALDRALSLPLYPDLADDESDLVISVALDLLS